jgi:hypothetical protein
MRTGRVGVIGVVVDAGRDVRVAQPVIAAGDGSDPRVARPQRCIRRRADTETAEAGQLNRIHAQVSGSNDQWRVRVAAARPPGPHAQLT